MLTTADSPANPANPGLARRLARQHLLSHRFDTSHIFNRDTRVLLVPRFYGLRYGSAPAAGDFERLKRSSASCKSRVWAERFRFSCHAFWMPLIELCGHG